MFAKNHSSSGPDIGRRRTLALMGAALVGGWAASHPAMAQIQSQKPVVPGSGAKPMATAGALEILNDGSFVDSIDGQRERVAFSLGSRHTIRGLGLANAVQGFLLSTRTAGDQVANIGSSLFIEANSDTELVVQISGTSAGTSVWKPGYNDAAIYMVLRTDGGAREFNFIIPYATYACDPGQANCG